MACMIFRGCLPLKPVIDDSDPDAGLKRFMWSICQKCWRKNPNERPSMREILEEMLDYPLKDTYSVSGGNESPSGIEGPGKKAIASSSGAINSV